MHHQTDNIAHIMAFVTPIVEHWLEREIAQWVHHEGSGETESLLKKKCFEGGGGGAKGKQTFIWGGGGGGKRTASQVPSPTVTPLHEGSIGRSIAP